MDFKQVNIGWETVNFEQAFDHQLLYSENFVRVYGVAATHVFDKTAINPFLVNVVILCSLKTETEIYKMETLTRNG